MSPNTLPGRFRFRVRALLAILVLFAALLSLARGPFSLNVASGHLTVPLVFEINDASSGRPVPGATIQLVDESGILTHSAASNNTGHAAIFFQTRFGRRTTYGVIHELSLDYGDRWLIVSAAGYQQVRAPLTQFTNDRRYHVTNPPPIVIRLKPGSATAANRSAT
jgi:hypothetical protein